MLIVKVALVTKKKTLVIVSDDTSPVFIKYLQIGEFFPALEPGKWVDFPMGSVRTI